MGTRIMLSGVSALTLALVLALVVACNRNDRAASNPVSPPAAAPARQAAAPTDEDIVNAYVYLLGRLLILRQQRLDFEKGGFEWNKAVHHPRGGVDWPNPNLDVLYTEAWVAVDENTCIQVELPKITGRYYTWEMLNGWGEVSVNINERTFPQQPHGKYALCLKGSHAQVPPGMLRVDLPSKTSRVLTRIELGADPAQAARLQKQMTLTPLGQPRIEPYPKVPLFDNVTFMGAEAFDFADAILKGEPDINPGMEAIRRTVADVAALAKSGPAGRERVQKVIQTQAVPQFLKRAHAFDASRNGWIRASKSGNYGDDYWMRSIVDFVGIWGNNPGEVVYYGQVGLDGGASYTQTYPASELPRDKATYFWSVIAVDGRDFRVIPNRLDRFLLNNQSPLKYNADGSLTLGFGPQVPRGVPESNWLPTPKGEPYTLTYRFYGPHEDIVQGRWFPPALVRQD